MYQFFIQQQILENENVAKMVKKEKDFIDNKRKTKKLLPSLQRKNTKKTVRLLLISSRKELKK